ncbi:MAG: 16S rRNA processing protein RimM [Caldilineaceae bacterium]|nr:16S rRNA processing protein RimM [Caldilineaceae bacterium]
MSQESNPGDDRRRRRQNRRRGHASRRGPLDFKVPAGYLVVGRVISAHGVRGELSIEPFTDFPEDRFAAGQMMLIGDEMEAVEIESARPHKNRVLICFDHITNREEAEALRGNWIFIAEEDAAELDEDTYYVHQIVGLTAQTADGAILGTVKDVLVTGANDVYLVAPAEGVNGGKEILLPAIGDVIVDVDVAGGRLTVNLLPGMLDSEAE